MSSHRDELAARQEAILARLDALSQRLQTISNAPPAAQPEVFEVDNVIKGSRMADVDEDTTGRSLSMTDAGKSNVSLGVEERLSAILRKGGVNEFKFKKVSENYYDTPLESRQAELQAASVDHLCKSIVMVRQGLYFRLSGSRLQLTKSCHSAFRGTVFNRCILSMITMTLSGGACDFRI